MRRFGQAKIPASFISSSSSVNQDPQPKPSKKPISLSDFLNRKLGKTSGRLLQEKQISIGSLGPDKKDFDAKRNEDGSILMPKGAIFRQFSRALKGKDNFELGDGAENEQQQYSSKRKRPSEFSSGDTANHQKYLVVLGDDPKLRPKRSEQKPMDKSAKTIYNHYANGQGWWDGDKEGIDSEEVGYNEIWEGLGSTTLGGLEWH